MYDINVDETDLKKLNWYDLQRALYSAHLVRDQADTHDKGTAQVKAVLGEYRRRGVTKFAMPDL